MRPNKFIIEVNKAIQHKLTTGSNEFFTPYLIKRMKRAVKEWQVEEEDFRTGYETYGYENKSSIMNNLEYISDRWRCAFRLTWLVDGIENGCI